MATTATRNTHRTHKAVKPGKYTNALVGHLPCSSPLLNHWTPDHQGN